MYFFAARQPILDREKKLYAYELLFRDSVVNVFPKVDADEATTKMIEASNFSLGLCEFTGSKPAFINFTLDTLCKGYPETLTTEEVVIEILETVRPGKKLLAICQSLHKKGYTIALDDYIHQPTWRHFYPFIKIIKIDWQDTTLETIKEVKKCIANYPHIQLLAEKVETYKEYHQALELGFELFQGFFFAKPEMIKTKNLSPSQAAMAELLQEASKPDLNIENMASVFERDVTLSYKLLRYANSPIFRRGNKISTIKQALVILGAAELRRFLGLMFATNANPNKPSELINSAMTRAKFCELVASSAKSPVDTSIAFLSGLLSLIDAIVDEKLDSILSKLPLAQEIKDTLLTRQGVMAELIKLVEFIEKAKWNKTNMLMEELGLDKAEVVNYYNQAIIWADDYANADIKSDT